MLAGVTHRSAQRSYADLQRSITEWGDGDDAMDRLGALLGGTDESAGSEDAGLKFAGKFAGKLRKKAEAAAAAEPDSATTSERRSSESGTESSTQGDGAKKKKTRTKPKKAVGLYDEAVADYRGRVAETSQWATENGLAGEEDGLPDRARVLASIQGIDHWWMEQRKAMVLGPVAEHDGDKDVMLSRLVAGVPRRARPSTAEKELQVLAAEEERQKVRLEKLAKKTPAQRLAAAKARREAAAAAAMGMHSVLDADAKPWRSNARKVTTQGRPKPTGQAAQRSIYDNSLEVMPGEGEADGSDEEGIYDGLSPRTDHPAWLLLPKRASALVKQLPPGIAAASKSKGRRGTKQRPLEELAAGFWDERHTALSMQLRAPPTPEASASGGGGEEGSGGQAVTGRYRRQAKALAAQAKAAPGLAALLGSPTGSTKPGDAYKAGRRAKAKAELPAGVMVKRSPSKAQTAFRSGHALASSPSPKPRRRQADGEDGLSPARRMPGLGGTGEEKTGGRGESGAPRGVAGGWRQPDTYTVPKPRITSPPRARAAVTMAEMRGQKSGSKYLLIDV